MDKEIQELEVKGLKFIPELISQFQEAQVIENIKISEWNTSLKRRTQHYGYEYSYDRKSEAKQTTPIPEWVLPIKFKLEEVLSEEEQKIKFDQMIVNEYQPGQGISPHIDHLELFGPTIVSVSLGSPALMIFTNKENKVQVVLKRRSAVVLQGQARYQWKHSIPNRKKDHGVPRGTRYSLTFRTMK